MKHAVLAASLLALTSCGVIGGDVFQCTLVLQDQPHGCMEFTDFDRDAGGALLQGSFASFCAAAGFGDVGEGECPVGGRIAGCLEEGPNYTVTKWKYEHPLQEEGIEEMSCDAGGEKLFPNGEPYTDEPPRQADAPAICSPADTAEAISVQVVNTGDRTMTVYWGTYECTELQMGPVAPGATFDLDTTAGHVFRVRAGGGYADGLVLLDFTAAPGGVYEASW